MTLNIFEVINNSISDFVENKKIKRSREVQALIRYRLEALSSGKSRQQKY